VLGHIFNKQNIQQIDIMKYLNFIIISPSTDSFIFSFVSKKIFAVSSNISTTAEESRPPNPFELDNQGNFMPSGPFGGIGFAWPTALGANLARLDD
jgi:hypothetical protein